MKRPIFVGTLGFISGIILGVYLNISLFIYFSIIIFLVILKFVMPTHIKFIKIVYIFIKINMIILFGIFLVVGDLYIKAWNKEYNYIYNNLSNEDVIGIIVSNKQEKKYKDLYIIRIEYINNRKTTSMYFILELKKKVNVELKYGDKISFKGEYSLPEVSRNYKGFNYREYLKSKKIYGVLSTENLNILESNSLNVVELSSNKFKIGIIENINKILPEDTKELFLGILIGYTDNLQENIQEQFRKSSLTHLLAVSGAHIAYIILALTYILIIFRIPIHLRNFLIILFLIFFTYITDFSSSVLRATIMGIIVLLQNFFYKRQDIKTTMSVSLLVILISNPYKIFDIGLVLSYFATIGILIFTNLKSIYDKKDVKNDNKLTILIKYIKDIAIITLFANVFVIPIILYNFNTLSFTFILSNLVAGIIIAPITIGGFILVLISYTNIKLAYIISIIYNLLLKALVINAQLVSYIPFSQLIVYTPSIISIVFYYIFLFLLTSYFFLIKKYKNRYLVKKIIKKKNSLINFCNNNIKIIVVAICIILFLFFSVINLPKDLRIYFIDVGQGDSTLVETSYNKKILIDSGGTEYGDFDVGKSILVPYILDRKITCIDYICISHFDSDHCNGFVYLLNNIKVKNIVISKQSESTNNFETIINIARKKNINIILVKSKDIIQIDRYTRIIILNPNEELRKDINDNSIVMKLEYLNFSFLFTGDISDKIERDLVNRYKEYLESDILKIAHHGSKTSSSELFINTVKPRMTLIGVGKNNKFRTS